MSISRSKNNLIKNGQKTQIDIFPKKTYGWETHEKMLNITNYQGNANQNHNKMSPHIVRLARIKKKMITGLKKQ